MPCSSFLQRQDDGLYSVVRVGSVRSSAEQIRGRLANSKQIDLDKDIQVWWMQIGCTK